MIRMTRYATGVLAAAPRPVLLRVVRHGDPAAIQGRRSQRPAWGLLYAIVFLAILALSAIEYVLPEGGVRSLADLLAVCGCLGLTRLWVGANRRSLSRIRTERSDENEPGATVSSDREVG